ncbi:MAG: hypothetical protein ACF8NJ_01190 [Phycisphaerales bacterium JB038]
MMTERSNSTTPKGRRLLVLATLGLALAATVVQGWQGTGTPGTDLRSLSPAGQRQWVVDRLQALEEEQTRLRELLATLDAGGAIEAPYPITPGWTSPGELQPTPRQWEPIEEMRPLLTPESAPRQWSELSVDEQSAYYDMALQMAPEMRGELEELQQNEPEQYQELMQVNLGRLSEMLELRDRDETVFRLRQRDSELARQTTRRAEEIERLRGEGEIGQANALEDELRADLLEHFQVRQDIRKHELDRLAVRLRDLEEELAVRGERSDDLVEARLGELLDRFAVQAGGE